MKYWYRHRKKKYYLEHPVFYWYLNRHYPFDTHESLSLSLSCPHTDTHTHTNEPTPPHSNTHTPTRTNTPSLFLLFSAPPSTPILWWKMFDTANNSIIRLSGSQFENYLPFSHSILASVTHHQLLAPGRPILSPPCIHSGLPVVSRSEKYPGFLNCGTLFEEVITRR